MPKVQVNVETLVKTINTAEDLAQAMQIRVTVFVEEQHVPFDEEQDEFEAESRHYLALVDGLPAATARWRKTAKGSKLERFAVLQAYRGSGVGRAILNKVLADAIADDGNAIIYLNAQTAAVPFYEKAGFAGRSAVFYECDIPHIMMEYSPRIILAIETSCDDTGAAVIIEGKVASNVVATQLVHQKYGGVVPELASRAHQQHIIPVIMEALAVAGVTKNQLSAVAFTQGPGLLGALLVGNSLAKGVALSLNIPLIGVNHMKAHILAHFIEEPRPAFPFLCLTVSGGHTQIVLVNSPADMQVLGETGDDAVGEAFDKSAKLLGLPYPGGPLIDKLAREGNPQAYKFPIVEVDGLNFSFSGVKTAIMYFLRDKGKEYVDAHLPDICASIQYTLIEILMRKLRKAAKEQGINRIAIAGGVSANSGLRATLEQEAAKQGWQVFIPAFQYCTDNAGMIAMSAWFQFLQGDFVGQDASPLARMPV